MPVGTCRVVISGSIDREIQQCEHTEVEGLGRRNGLTTRTPIVRVKAVSLHSNS